MRSVRDAEGRDVSRAFLLDQCYVLELLRGREAKVNDPRAEIPGLAEIKAQFARNGIGYICDSSAFLLADGSVKLVDIAVRDIRGLGVGW